MVQKKCFLCKTIKNISEFYRHFRMPDGHLNKCKECAKSDVRRNYKKNVEYYKKYEQSRLRDPRRMQARRDYQKTSGGKKAHARANAAYRHRRPDIVAAHNAVTKAIASGKLRRMPCTVCEKKPAEAHHPDYSKKLDVVWLCSEHHKEHHRIHGGEYFGR